MGAQNPDRGWSRVRWRRPRQHSVPIQQCYTLVGSVTPGHAASLSDDDLLGLLAGRGADFVVITAGSDEAESGHAALDSPRPLGIPIALVPGLRGLPVTGFRHHYFPGHDIVMLVGSSNLTQPFSRLLTTAFDQIAAIILLLLMAPLPLVLATLVRAEVARYGRKIEHYYAAEPGLTGLWQVSGRSDMSYTRVQLDVWCVRNWSPWHDIAILFKTIPRCSFSVERTRLYVTIVP